MTQHFTIPSCAIDSGDGGPHTEREWYRDCQHILTSVSFSCYSGSAYLQRDNVRSRVSPHGTTECMTSILCIPTWGRFHQRRARDIWLPIFAGLGNLMEASICVPCIPEVGLQKTVDVDQPIGVKRSARGWRAPPSDPTLAKLYLYFELALSQHPRRVCTTC